MLVFRQDDEFRLKPGRGHGGPPISTTRVRNLGSGARVSSAGPGRCFCSVRFMSLGKNGASRLAQHVKYLQRESATMKTGEDIRTFGNVSPDEMTHFKPGEKRMFKVVLSPEEYFSLGSVDSFVHAFMGQVQTRAGRYGGGQTVDWIGYLHTNTPAPHVHLLIRGLARDGEDFFLRRETLKGLRHVAADIQNGMTGGLEVSREVRAERTWVTSFRVLPRHRGLSIDEHLQSLPVDSSYDAVMKSVPLYRRKALHGRLIFLERNGFVSIDSGRVVKQPGFSVDFSRMRDLQGDIVKSGLLRDTKAEALYFDDRVTSTLGLVTGTAATRHHGLVAVIESVKNETIVLPIHPSERERYEKLARAGDVVNYKSGIVDVLEGDPLERLDKLRSRGPVVDRIRATTQRERDSEQER